MTEKTKDFMKITTRLIIMLYIGLFTVFGIFHIKHLYNLSLAITSILILTLIIAFSNTDNKKLIVKYEKNRRKI